MSMFRALSGIAACLVLVQVAAAQTPVLDKWRATIGALGCTSFEEGVRLNDDDYMLFVSSFSGTSLAEIAQAAGLGDISEFLLNAPSLLGRDDASQIIEALLVASPSAQRNFDAELARHGRNICPVLAYIKEVSLKETARLQVTQRAYWQVSLSSPRPFYT